MTSRRSRIQLSLNSGMQPLVYGKQTATALLFDFGSGFPGVACNDVCDALENLFSVACTMGGPSRLPIFSIVSLTHFPEVLLPLISVRGNYSRIQYSINEVRNLAHENAQPVQCERKGCIYKALANVCSDFQHKKGMFQVCQLEIVLIICASRDLSAVMKEVERAAVFINISNLKRIQVVDVCVAADLWTEYQGESPDNEESDQSCCSNLGGTVELLRIDSDPLSLQSFFNTWLKTTGSDNEQLHLLLPSAVSGSPQLIIKCDLQERLINPALLPFEEQYLLHPEGLCSKPLLPPVTKTTGVSISLMRIQTLGLLPATALCDSVVFGMPFIVQPTSSWKIEWDELEENQQNFSSLCYLLLQQKMVLYGQLTHCDAGVQASLLCQQYYSNRNTGEEVPCGYYVLIPAQNHTLLVKSFGCQELLLPCNHGSQLENPSQTSLQLVQKSFNMTVDVYNPLTKSSGLYTCLKSMLQRNKTRGQIKQKAEDTQRSVKLKCRSASFKNQKMKPLQKIGECLAVERSQSLFCHSVSSE